MTEPRRVCILVVETDVLIRNLIGMSLNNYGHFVLAAANHAEAIELSRNFPGEINLLIASSAGLAGAIAIDRPETRVILLSEVACEELKAIVRTVCPVVFPGHAALPRKLRDFIQQALADTSSGGAILEV